MGLRYILGRAGSGKTHRCCTEIRDYMAGSPDRHAFFIVPDQGTYTAEKTLASLCPGHGFTDVYVVGFSRLAYRIFQELHTDTGDALSPLGQQLILRRLLTEKEKQFRVLSTAARQPHFSESVTEFIHELDSYNISPEDLSAAAGSGPDSALSAKLADLALLYGSYADYLKEHFSYRGSRLHVLAEEVPSSELIRSSRIWVDGFSGMTPQEISVLSALIETAEEVTVTLPMGSRENASSSGTVFARPLGLMNRLSEKYGQAESLLLEDRPRFRTPVLAELEQKYFSVPSGKCGVSPAGLYLASGADRTAEAEDAARFIVHLARDEGCRWRDILILLRNVDAYADILTRTLERYQVPCFIDQRRSMWNHPLVVLTDAFLNILNAGSRAWTGGYLFRLLKTDLLPSLSADAVDRLENYVLRFGIRGSRWKEEWNFRSYFDLDKEQKEPSAAELEENRAMNDIRRQVCDMLLPSMDAWKAAQNAADRCAVLYQWLTEQHVPEMLADMDEEEYQESRTRTGGQVWKNLLLLLDEIVHAAGDEKISSADFLSMMEDGLMSMTFAFIPPTLDHVTVTSVDRGYSLEGRAVFILGACDGEFPCRVEERGLLTDREREELLDRSIDLGPNMTQRTVQEQFYVYLALTRARELLYLSYAKADSDGSELRPSFLYTRLQSLGYGISPPSPKHPDSPLFSNPAQALTLLPAMLRNGTANSPWRSFYAWAASKKEWQRPLAQALKSLNEKNIAEPLPPEIVRQLFLPSGRFHGSVTQLEQYRQCPYSYFMKYGMRLREREDGSLGSIDYGNYLHAGLHLFGDLFLKQKKQWRDATEGDIEKLSVQISEQLVPRVKNGRLTSDAACRHIRDTLNRTFRYALSRLSGWSRNSHFDTNALEKKFSVDIPCPGGPPATLEGKIDRIDIMGNAVAVCDYKSGSPGISLAEITNGLKLQLITYMLAILLTEQTKKEVRALMPAACMYIYISDEIQSLSSPPSPGEEEIPPTQGASGYVLHDPNVLEALDSHMEDSDAFFPVSFKKDGTPRAGAPVLTQEEFRALLSRVQEWIGKLCREIAGGDIRIRPVKHGSAIACQYCPYSGICRFDPKRPENRYDFIPKQRESDAHRELSDSIKEEKEENSHDALD